MLPTITTSDIHRWDLLGGGRRNLERVALVVRRWCLEKAVPGGGRVWGDPRMARAVEGGRGARSARRPGLVITM